MNLDDLSLEYRQGQSGIRVKGMFIPFLKEGERPGVILCVPWKWNLVEGASQNSCDRCGQPISLAPSSREILKQFPDVPTRCIFCMNREAMEMGKWRKE